VQIKLKSLLFAALGFVFLGLGAAGVVLPVLPTTPFVLLAALCFSAGSAKLHNWLRRNRVFGQYIENYRTGQGITRPLKIASIAFLWAGLLVSMAVARAVWMYVLLGAVGAGVTAHLLLLKTRAPKKNGEDAAK
jgi:uncharacterized membrane protein YbaN (DUF454 family)